MESINKIISELVRAVREQSPLVHHITNYVTVNDCANIVLALGGSPVMADDKKEVEDITSIASALVLNIGTLNERTIASMVAAGKKANLLGIPIVLDPVGAGASKFRNETTIELLNQLKISILRGNLSEISFVAGQEASTKGVDASIADANKDGISIAKYVALKYDCITAITGAIDIISDGNRVVTVENGNPLMAKITGTGCMSTSLTGAFHGISSDAFMAAVAGISTMGVAGEIAYEVAGTVGTGSYRSAIINAVSQMDSTTLEKRVLIHEF